MCQYCNLIFPDAQPPIVYRYTKTYSKIWDDSGSGAPRDVSIWRPTVVQSGYYPLGDVAVAKHGAPLIEAITVSETEAGSLQAPKGFSEVWSDHGSGADSDVRMFEMTAPSTDYVCLGHVAINSYSELPDVNNYR